MGYAGGEQPDPTYAEIADHTETLEIDYDPNVVSYETLLKMFWASHDPAQPSWSRQYMTAVFYNDERQRKLAEISKREVEDKYGVDVQTKLLPITKFYLAEDYHQKYQLRHDDRLMTELRAYYGDGDLVHSTVAARLNGYLAGHGTPELLHTEAPRYGLSAESVERLFGLVHGRK